MTRQVTPFRQFDREPQGQYNRQIGHIRSFGDAVSGCLDHHLDIPKPHIRPQQYVFRIATTQPTTRNFLYRIFSLSAVGTGLQSVPLLLTSSKFSYYYPLCIFYSCIVLAGCLGEPRKPARFSWQREATLHRKSATYFCFPERSTDERSNQTDRFIFVIRIVCFSFLVPQHRFEDRWRIIFMNVVPTRAISQSIVLA